MDNKYKESFINIVLEDYQNGLSIVQLSNKYSVDRTTIKNWLDKYNVPDNYTGRFSQRYEINGNEAYIYIKYRGSFKKAIIDSEDVDRCKSVGIWSLTKDGYIINCKTGMYLHRYIMNCPNDLEVDHIYHDLLDNRKSQLRLATSSQQKMNTGIRKDNISGHRGVYFDSSRQQWAVHLKDGDSRVTKRFNSYDDACSFCDKKIQDIHKEFQYKSNI